MILFAGSQERGFFVQETAAMKNMDLGYLEGSLTIQNHINGILNRQCDYLIFDIEQYVDPAEVVAAEIKRLERAKNCDVIIYAPGYDRQSRVIKELQYQGIVYYIFSANQTEARQELEQCLSGYYREPEQNATWEEQKEELKSGIKIGIAGVCRRMGTTTFAIQLVKYLQLKGHKACYLEVNDSGFVQKHEERFYAEAYDENLGKVTFEGVDMFYKPENLPEVLKQEYDYYIYKKIPYNELLERQNLVKSGELDLGQMTEYRERAQGEKKQEADKPKQEQAGNIVAERNGKTGEQLILEGFKEEENLLVAKIRYKGEDLEEGIWKVGNEIYLQTGMAFDNTSEKHLLTEEQVERMNQFLKENHYELDETYPILQLKACGESLEQKSMQRESYLNRLQQQEMQKNQQAQAVSLPAIGMEL